jgi:hypothetical protein
MTSSWRHFIYCRDLAVTRVVWQKLTESSEEPAVAISYSECEIYSTFRLIRAKVHGVNCKKLVMFLRPEAATDLYMYTCMWGQHGSVGIATRCGLDGQRIESRWGEGFAAARTVPGAYKNRSWVSSTGVKRPGRGVNNPPPSSAEVKERIELYLYFPSGSSWPVLGRTLPLPLCMYMYVCMWRCVEYINYLACNDDVFS